jgi:hypothetical protein
MAALAYASFPAACAEALSSPSAGILPLEQLPLMDSLRSPKEIVEVIDAAAKTDGDESNGIAPADSFMYHLTPTTPTKERVRRATVPASGGHRPQEVLPILSFPVWSLPQIVSDLLINALIIL